MSLRLEIQSSEPVKSEEVVGPSSGLPDLPVNN